MLRGGLAGPVSKLRRVHVTVIGHSCLLIKTRAGTILVDPWLFGSCYWRSWWHYPPSVTPDEEMLRPDFVYLTHHHFDHFHYPSLRQIDRSARVLIPKFGVDVMAGEVIGLGFDRPRELPHGQVVQLDSDVRIGSFQHGFDDSAFVVADGDDVVVDLNDAKTRGLSLGRVARRFGPPTIVCKSHSFAQSYPVCYVADDPADLALINRDAYIEDFRSAMETLRPRYAIPFGSMVGFLHPESRPVNDHVVTPPEVVAGIAERGGLADGAVVAMAPGDSWSSESGFDLRETDWYADRSAHLDELAAAAAPAIEARSRSEQGVKLEWSAFEDYFRGFVTQCPRLVSRRLVPKRIVFRVPSDSVLPYWWVSFRDRAVGRSDQPPSDRAGVISAPEAILVDAIENRIAHMVQISMRIRTELAPGGTRSDLAFWGLLEAWELGYLPLRRSAFRPRFWTTAARRWREGIDVLRAWLSPPGSPVAAAEVLLSGRSPGPSGGLQ